MQPISMVFLLMGCRVKPGNDDGINGTYPKFNSLKKSLPL